MDVLSANIAREIRGRLKVKVKAYWTRSCASKVWKRCPFRGETVKNWEGSRVREK